ncbi:similar to Saccharomyces cerevisiae YLR170C APS1 Small subunit of the clathrin- associated adaptor complex AP-1, which is involved in protein sorting at the trans-Golgi network [Maudiozyma barnettii]|uniref:AP complex subunit sigma n=1 Tax=Maudiozyma barnettii TaxID=61262 RepID=A0A8H2ZI62_9SACH|nr:Aps1p [Kazachstania barnettii]CAB4256539.1 similar to Saccharomyces cerevisiae YLR170C APS1 Small subunit of the clathrin- associated adaptor complex AP-1, which is involved in protein sorting at the trans-Golgi network [Kazachstania barnettii]CAD1785142.1 similar to Saccharomyces cerevisiae YLR170C APS1 Small subunit of the clathrin- associated adaptor complex AP-1, which is involved in protein sorting at the trans-Golgi network [Kazachstania barnettii]
MSHIKYLLLVSRQGKARLMQWYTPFTPKQKTKIINDLTPLILARKPKMCNILEYSDHKVVYRRYASLYFICGITNDQDNELLTLEIIHRFVETMDTYFGNVCELDIIFHFDKAYDILNELIMCDGSMAESSKKEILNNVHAMDAIVSNDHLDRVLS